MTLKIGSIIRNLRMGRGLTQEKLAEHLGVSCQAVSKWESESGYPDIELIPALAYYFNVTTDELLGVESARNKEIVDGYLTRCLELSHDPTSQLAQAREAAAQFPNNALLLQNLMYALVFNIALHKKPEESGEIITKATALKEKVNGELLGEAVAIAERILKECLDDGARHCAIQVLCYYYPMLGRKNDAVLLAQAMPPLYLSRDALLEEIYSDEEKIRRLQINICRMAEALCSNIVSVADPDGQQQNSIPVDEKIRLIETANEIYKLVFKYNDLNLYNGALAYNYRLMAALALLDGQADCALGFLEQAAEYAIAADTIRSDTPFISPAVSRLTNGDLEERDTGAMSALSRLFYKNIVSNRIVMKIDNIAGNHTGFLRTKLEQRRYDAIRDTDRFQSILCKLETAH